MDESKVRQALALLASAITESAAPPTAAAVAPPGPGVPLPPPPPVGWWHYPLAFRPTAPITDLTDVEALKQYMATGGLKANLTIGTPPQDWPWVIGRADAIYNANTPEEAEAAMGGASHYDYDTAIYLVAGGCYEGREMGQPKIYAPYGKWNGITAAAAYLINQPIPGQPGPSGK